ncbi:uncharacterized protein LOC130949283 [Arachis stenosperma]|uniref:uncharacterized protein LOC130949283 n=1 Tax=Arachis stenosperma TaxID=217475 RepID=UPI0025AB9610|nr:uncharacterized protein LOC130949283 [Arachis stenosperma]
MQKDQETLYEYWSRFKRLLKTCPHHGLNTHLLISYFTGGLCAEDRRLLTASSGGSLSKNKTEAEAWSLINDVAEATQHVRVRSNPLKGIAEASPSEASLTKGTLNAITLWSGTTLEKIPPRTLEDIHEEEVVVEAPHGEKEMSTRQEKEEVNLKEPKRKATMDESIPISFPSMIKKAKKAPEFDLNMLQVFKKVEVTIPLLDVIQQILKYAKFLKDLCTHKDRISELETLSLGSSISALMKPIPEKFGDPGPCLVSCSIGGVVFHDCMCDLGACVSIMPFSVFARLNMAPLKRSAARFALADKSIITVMGIAEYVLVAIKDLVFPVDFYILEMPPTEGRSSSSVLLGRPFLKTSKFKLDAYTGTYSFEVEDKTIKFNLEEAMKHPPEEHSVLLSDVIDEVVAEI